MLSIQKEWFFQWFFSNVSINKYKFIILLTQGGKIMLNLIIGIGIGVVGSSIGWFFVWRNNKKLLQEKIEKVDKMMGKMEKN